MSLTFTTAVDSVSSYLQDTGNVRWSATIIGVYYNDGLRDFARGSKIIKKVSGNLLPDQTTTPYNAFYALPSDMFELESVRCNSILLYPAALASMPWKWDTITGQPTRYLYGEYGLSDIRVWPYTDDGPIWTINTAYTVGQTVVGLAPNGANVYVCTHLGTSLGSGTGPSGTGTNIADGATLKWAWSRLSAAVTVNYTAVPADISGSTVSTIPAIYQNAAVYYAVAQCYLQDGQYKDPSKGAGFMQLYQRELADATARTQRGFRSDAVYIGYRHV